MYKLSFEKCVCFVFLVILAFLGCSGFHIGRLATMNGDVSARNSYTSPSVIDSPRDYFLERLFATSHGRTATPYDTFQSNSDSNPYSQARQLRLRHHKIRHSHGLRLPEEAQAAQVIERSKPSGRIETFIITPPSSTRANDLEPKRFANTPSSRGHPHPIHEDDDTRRVVSRPQRSSDKKRSSRKRGYHCQRQDVARKAYLANTVVRAKAESMSSNRIHNYSVTFRILERYKTPFAIDDTLRLSFYNDTKDMNCETEARGKHGLVKAQIQQSREYFLFLNSDGMHNYSLVGMPVLKKKRIKNRKNRDLDDIRKVTSKTFVLKPPKIPNINSTSSNLKPEKKLRLVCKFQGFPPPYVSWHKDGHILHPNSRTRISYKRRKTTLVINGLQMKDAGVYQCVVKGVDGRTAHVNQTVRISNSEQEPVVECEGKYKDSFCLNGGTCRVVIPGETGCVCADGFSGNRCEQKDVTYVISL